MLEIHNMFLIFCWELKNQDLLVEEEDDYLSSLANCIAGLAIKRHPSVLKSMFSAESSDSPRGYLPCHCRDKNRVTKIGSQK